MNVAGLLAIFLLVPTAVCASTAPWRLSQDLSRPWMGTPQMDVADHRNGAVRAGEAVFSDPRWAARAMAIELRDYHRAGARSSADYASSLTRSCNRFGGQACGVDPAALAKAFGASQVDDLQLFTARDLPTPRLRAALTALALMMTGETPSAALLDVAAGSVEDDDLDQSAAGYSAWLKRGPDRPAKVRELERVLAQGGVLGVVPTWQLLRTGSDWRGCGAPFEIPPSELQSHVVATLKIARDRVEKAVGPIEAKSAYRGPWLNVCAGGAEASAHREFSAIDLVPLAPISRQALMTSICPVYARSDADDRLGLGFYAGVRFHIDTQRHRSWAYENGRAYAPCTADGAVNPPLPPLPSNSLLPPAPPSR